MAGDFGVGGCFPGRDQVELAGFHWYQALGGALDLRGKFGILYARGAVGQSRAPEGSSYSGFEEPLHSVVYHYPT